jgi:hypothetical protein
MNQTKRELRKKEIERLKRFHGQIVTMELIEEAKTVAGGYINEFFRAIGERTQNNSGWRQRSIGRIFQAQGMPIQQEYAPKMDSEKALEMLTEEFRDEIDALKARVSALEEKT